MKAPSHALSLKKGVFMNSATYGIIAGLNGVSKPTSFTFLIWCRQTSLLDKKANISRAFLGMTHAGGDFIRMGSQGVGSPISLAAKVGAGVFDFQIGNELPNDFKTHCYCWTYDGLNCKMGWDGSFNGTFPLSNSNVPSFFRTVNINRDNADSSRILPMVVYEDRFLPQTISDDDFIKFYNKGKGSSHLDSLPHVFWHKHEENGSDESGNGYTMTFGGSPSYL
jgi:hypothetical protein